MNRLRVKAGRRALAFWFVTVFTCIGANAVPVRADDAGTDYWFAGTRLIFEQPQMSGEALAVSTTDSGLARFLGVTGATLAYQPGQKYVVVTSADRRTIAFTLGSTRYAVAGVTQTAPFAPYAAGDAVYLPFIALANALYVDAVPDGATTVLQPEIGALDVRSEKRATVLTLRGATALRFRRVTAAGDSHVVLSFSGVGTTLERDRTVGQPALAGITIASAGTPKNPTTIVDFNATPGSLHALLPSEFPGSLTLEFAPPDVALRGWPLPAHGATAVAAASVPGIAALRPAPPFTPQNPPEGRPTPVASAPPALGPSAQVTAVTSQPTADDGFDLHVSLSANVTYEWHRLPDDRWYVDLKPAMLAIAPIDESLQDDTVKALRVKGFVGPHDGLPTVRIAFTLVSPRVVNLLANPGGATIAIDPVDDANPQRVGYGQLVDGRLVAAAATPAPLPPANEEPAPIPTGTWKFAPPLAPGSGSRIIVIDPGHGGSDSGALHNGLIEKDLNLDMSRRLRDLLVARGWTVKMTRDSDVDVYQPNDSARDELQARDDVANALHARLFISVHSNAFPRSGEVNGTTTYYYKADSYAFARAVHARLVADLPTTDDGIIKDNFYVIHHAAMPAILIETAFLTSPRDAALLRDPAFLQKVAVAIAEGVGAYVAAPAPVSQLPAADGSER